MSKLQCPSCSGPLMEKPPSSPAVCTRCGASFHFDEYGSYVPLTAPCRVGESEATTKILEWASSVKGGREFAKNIELAKMTRRFYPVYYFDRQREGSRGSVVASAVALAEPGLRNLDLTIVDMHGAGGVMPDPAEIVKPSLSPAAYEKLLSVDPASRTLIYYPFWCTQYVYHGKLSTVTVDGCTGRVSGDLSVEIERKSSMPFAASAFAILGLEGMIAYYSWIVAAAVVGATALVTVYMSRRGREE